MRPPINYAFLSGKIEAILTMADLKYNHLFKSDIERQRFRDEIQADLARVKIEERVYSGDKTLG